MLVIDAESLYGHRLFATGSKPFDRIMPLEDLRGKAVYLRQGRIAFDGNVFRQTGPLVFRDPIGSD